MNSPEIELWGIHTDQTADALFLYTNCVGLPCLKIGDLSRIAPDRKAFEVATVNAYPDSMPGAIPKNAEQLYPFVHEMKVGDLIAYSSEGDPQIHLGRVDGNYTFDPTTEPCYPHVRRVKWLCEIPRTKLSREALDELGSSNSFIHIKTCAHEFQSAIVSKQ